MSNDIQNIQKKIYVIRGQRVMLDRDLAELYGVTTSNYEYNSCNTSKDFSSGKLGTWRR